MNVANPWLNLPQHAPYVLPDDEDKLSAYRDEQPSNTDYRLHLPPLPFQGRPDAPIVLLGLNPGYSEVNDEKWHRRPEF